MRKIDRHKNFVLCALMIFFFSRLYFLKPFFNTFNCFFVTNYFKNFFLQALMIDILNLKFEISKKQFPSHFFETLVALWMHLYSSSFNFKVVFKCYAFFFEPFYTVILRVGVNLSYIFPLPEHRL